MTEVEIILRDAAALIESRGWTQGACARTESGARVEWNSNRAARWCASGAILHCSPDTAAMILTNTLSRARCALVSVVGESIAAWNDAPGRTQGEVVAALRLAADRAQDTGEGT